MHPSAPRWTGPSPALSLVCSLIPEPIAGRWSSAGTALEVGCGGGLGSLAMAASFPALQMTGHDLDAVAIARARALASAARLGDRVRFEVDDSLRLSRASLDLVVVSGAVGRRDAPRLLNAIRNALVTDGACLLVERAPGGDQIRNLATAAGFSRVACVRRQEGIHLFELRR
jgi:predicted O-methyltransferase YrrM